MVGSPKIWRRKSSTFLLLAQTFLHSVRPGDTEKWKLDWVGLYFFSQLNQKTESFTLKVNQELLGAKGSEGDVGTGVVMISKTLLNV